MHCKTLYKSTSPHEDTRPPHKSIIQASPDPPRTANVRRRASRQPAPRLIVALADVIHRARIAPPQPSTAASASRVIAAHICTSRLVVRSPCAPHACTHPPAPRCVSFHFTPHAPTRALMFSHAHHARSCTHNAHHVTSLHATHTHTLPRSLTHPTRAHVPYPHALAALHFHAHHAHHARALMHPRFASRHFTSRHTHPHALPRSLTHPTSAHAPYSHAPAALHFTSLRKACLEGRPKTGTSVNKINY
jgi:hypothetical protein